MKNSYAELTFEELVAKRDELRRKFFDARVNKVVGHMDNPLELRMLRRQIARVNTRIANHPRVVGAGEE